MGQKRVYKRIEDLVSIEFTSHGSSSTTIIRTTTRDISAGGVKVYLNHQLKRGYKMHLAVTLPYTKGVIKAEAEVVKADLIDVVADQGEEMLFETRFKFAKVSPEMKNAITRYVFECRKKTNQVKARL